MHRLAPSRSSCPLVLIAGCSGGPRYSYTPTHNRAKTSKPAGCDFEVLTTSPGRPFEEIGVLESDLGLRAATIGAFREAVAGQVCTHGGDAVIAMVNGSGMYVKGTVVRFTSPETTAP